MDDAFGAFVVVIGFLALALLGFVFMIGGSMDATVVNACKERGYWQTGQVRVICSVEGEKK